MYSRAITSHSLVPRRNFNTPSKAGLKVTVLGAAGGIGQPLSMLLQTNPDFTHLSLYDIVNVKGVAADLSHIPGGKGRKVTGHTGDAELGAALKDSQIVVIPAGVPRKPGMTRDDLFNTNATIVRNLATGIAQNCPKALVLVISNPVNSTVPIVAETLKKAGVYDKRKVLGVTSLDTVRAHTFVGEVKNVNPLDLQVSVVGGHSGITIIPLLSQIKGLSFTQEEVEALTNRIQYGGDEVVKAKAGAGSATLSMAYAGATFTTSLIKVLRGTGSFVHNTYVESNIVPGVSYFASPIEFGVNGVEKINGLGNLSAYEKKLLENAIPELQSNIQKGVEFVTKA